MATPRENPFIEFIRGDNTEERDSGAVRLGPYKIDARMWSMWAAAAGLPNAKWEDKRAQEIVASYAARTLYDRFENWGLVAIGWRYGAGTAAKIQDIYGDTPAGNILKKILGKGGAAFVNSVLAAMNKVTNKDDEPPPPPSTSRGGSIDLTFTTEEGEPPPVEEPRDQAQMALIEILDGMANVTAGGQRMAIEDIEIADLEAAEEKMGVTPVTVTDTDRMNEGAASG
jgi:hypothetical protein